MTAARSEKLQDVVAVGGALPTGWIVEARHEARDGRPAHVTYWFGPDHRSGETSGGVTNTLSVAWFPTRALAEEALGGVFGAPRMWRGRGYIPVRLTAELLAAAAGGQA